LISVYWKYLMEYLRLRVLMETPVVEERMLMLYSRAIY